MPTRRRNSILFFLQNSGVREMLLDAARSDGWNAIGAADIHEAFQLFGTLGDSLALIVTDDMTGPDEGRHKGMMGVNFLQQRSTHMFIANIPFVILMFRGHANVRSWAESVEGWTVAMPNRVEVLLELFNRIEQEHQPPSKPRPRSGEL